MIKDIEAGKIETVIVKDMSRFGRNYLQVGFYTEMMFPQKNIRFIAINNGVDSINPQDNDFTPFLNIMNEWYAKDTSNKIRTIFHARMKDGLRCSGSVPYGYKRLPGDKQTFVVDEEAAKVVRRIFEMVIEGNSLSAIADKLTADKVLIPSAYWEQNEQTVSRNKSYHDKYRWNTTAIVGILDKQEYLGHTVLGKTIRESFKIKKRRKARPDELMIFPNTHEPIIDQETWDAAQRLRKRAPRRINKEKNTHRLSGLVFCADCGTRLSYTSRQLYKLADGTKKLGSETFRCSNYRNMYHGCTCHNIMAKVLEEAILKSIRSVSGYVINNENEFVEEIMNEWKGQISERSTEHEEELARHEKRMAELDGLIQGLYENFITEKLPERQYRRLMDSYDSEQSQLELRIAELKEQIQLETPDRPDSKRFIALVKKYRNCKELTDEMLYAFIERVEVHEATGGQGKNRQQQIDIYFNFIGEFNAPLSAEQLAEMEQEEKEIEERRERQRREAMRKASAKHRKSIKKLKEDAKTDPEAAKEYEKVLEKKLYK